MNSLSHSGISFLLVFLSVRGAGYQFGAQIVEKFLHVNNMRHILRAHQLCNEGYQVHQNSHECSKYRSYSTTDCQQCGPRQTIVIGVEIEHQFVKSATTAVCHSTYLTKPQRTDSSSKNSKCSRTRFVVSNKNANSSPPLHISYDHVHFWKRLYLWRLRRILD